MGADTAGKDLGDQDPGDGRQGEGIAGDRAQCEDKDRSAAPFGVVGPGAEQMGDADADAAREHHEAAAETIDEDHGQHGKNEVDGAGDNDVEE